MDDAFDRSKNLEQLALVWFDTENIVDNELEIRMRAIIDYFKFFNHADECYDYLRSTHQAKLFIIISSNYNKIDQIRHFLTTVHQFKHVHAVYVYLTDENNEREMDMDYPKVCGVYMELQKLVSELGEKVATLTKYANMLFECSTGGTTTSYIGINEMWYQRSIDIALSLPISNNDRQTLIDKCRMYYKGNTMTEEIIDEFEKTYDPDKAIWWYTRNCFLYRILNGVLRQKNMEAALYFRFYLLDICKQLKSVQEEYLEYFDDRPLLKTYRGQLMTREEVIYLEKFAGFTYSINSLLSTTTNRSTALIFSGITGSATPRSDGYISVLFEIEADTRLLQKPFAYIGHLSYFGSNEDEVLFMIGAMLLLTATQYDEQQNLHIFKFSLISYKDLTYPNPQLPSAISIESKFINIGYLIQRSYLHESHAAKYYNSLLNDFLGDSQNTCACYIGLGWIACENDKYDLALKYQTTALQLYDQARLSSTDLLLNIYNCLGAINRKENNYEQAMDFYIKAEQYNNVQCIDRQWINLDEFRNVSSIHMAAIYKLQQRFDLTWNMYLKTIEKIPNAKLHKMVFEYIVKAYNDSIENRKRFLDYTIQYLPSLYEFIVYSYVHIVELAVSRKDYDFAIDCLKKLLEIESKSGKSATHKKQYHYTNVPFLYKKIGCLYEEKGDLNSTIEWFEKAFETGMMFSQLISHNYLITPRHIALLYAKQGGEKVTLAIEWQKRFIEMLLKDKHNLQSCAMELALPQIEVCDIDSELWQINFLQLRISETKLCWNEVEVRSHHEDDASTYNNMIALSYYDIAKLCERSEEANLYYKKCVLSYLKNELQHLLRDVKPISIKAIESHFSTEQEVDERYRTCHYLNEEIPILWTTLRQQNVSNGCIKLIRTDSGTDPTSVIVSVRVQLEVFPENDYERLKNYYDSDYHRWINIGSMKHVRAFHTALKLPNGKILVVGGEGDGPAAAELYNPSTGKWSATGNMIYARNLHTASVLNNGKVLVVAGSGDSNSTELYDPSTGKWTAGAGVKYPRRMHTAVVLNDGRVLVTGGIVGGGTLLNTAELYDPSTGRWTVTSPMNQARNWHTASVLNDGKVLIVGGSNAAGEYVVITELYDPSSNTWTPADNLNYPRTYHTAVVLTDGKVLIIGGSDDEHGLLHTSELYDPSTGHWTTTGDLNEARMFPGACLLANGQVLVIGGQANNATPMNTAELYDPSTGTWTLTSKLNHARDGHTISVLNNGRVLVTGGYGNKLQSSAELYIPHTKDDQDRTEL
ncbi:unnamed protein product [Adineta ricciae]|uniref:Uncharacterized protein n=1 Tax=Adineta ricciae TaxID=249248 RepID=A0A815GW64_ADIRI|nr:unnamed protein product [Adineta ricciae]